MTFSRVSFICPASVCHSLSFLLGPLLLLLFWEARIFFQGNFLKQEANAREKTRFLPLSYGP